MANKNRAQNPLPENRKRDIQIKFWVSRSERELIDEKMEQAGTTSMGAYLRKMSIDGYLLRLELPELKEIVSLLRRCSNNLNQVAKLAHTTGRIYTDDIEDLTAQLDRLWKTSREILTSLAEMR